MSILSTVSFAIKLLLVPKETFFGLVDAALWCLAFDRTEVYSQVISLAFIDLAILNHREEATRPPR